MGIKTSESYQKEVLDKYHREKGGEMGIYLAKPTCRQIREACIYLLDKRNSRSDEKILIRFFQFQDDRHRIVEIQKFDADRFKPIVNFFKGKVRKTSPENIELISWLIDFHPRPLQEYLKTDYSKSTSAKSKSETFERSDASGYNRKREERRRQEEDRALKKLVITISIAFGAVLMTSLIFKNQVFREDNNSGMVYPRSKSRISTDVIGKDINRFASCRHCMTRTDPSCVTKGYLHHICT